MFTNFYNMHPESHHDWKNASEIEVAAHEHDKRRYQMIDEEVSPVNQRGQSARGSHSGRRSILSTAAYLLTILLG